MRCGSARRSRPRRSLRRRRRNRRPDPPRRPCPGSRSRSSTITAGRFLTCVTRWSRLTGGASPARWVRTARRASRPSRRAPARSSSPSCRTIPGSQRREVAMPPAKVAPAAKNKLVVRVQRRITVELGDLDAVFAAANTVQGKKQRLQALGYYYEPLSAAAANTATEAYTRCLEIWRKRREEKTGRKIKSAAEIAKELPIHLREFIVDKGKLPASGGERRVRVP